MNKDINTKTAFIAIIGRPNVGKSTLLNMLMNEKISIVSKKPQTTRTKITGILTEDNKQYVFLDTPGVHIPKSILGKYMVNTANDVINDSELVLLLVEPINNIGKIEENLIEKLNSKNIPVILVINKTDTVPKPEILGVMKLYTDKYKFESVIPISALNNDGVDILKKEFDKYLVNSEFLFPDDIITDQPEKQIVAEVIREKALRLLDDEIPHGIAVDIEKFIDNESKKLISVNAVIICEKETHKRIVIGKNGDMIKKIGSYAREDLEKFFGVKIYLELWVKIRENWRDSRNILNDIGYRQ